MWMVLANIATPLFYVGIALSVLSLIWLGIHFIGTRGRSVSDDSWIIAQRRIKQAITGLLIGAVLITVSFGVDGVDEPYVKTVVKERVVEKEVMPTYIQLYNQCTEDMNLVGISTGSDQRTNAIRTCQKLANDQFVSLTEGPIRTRTVTKVTYKRLPFETFMKQCGAKSRASGVEGMEMLDRLHARCLEAASTHMRGLVQKANDQ